MNGVLAREGLPALDRDIDEVRLELERAGPAPDPLRAGIYSLYTIDGGTFQVGLTVMDFIVSLSSGVCLPGLGSPITIRDRRPCASAGASPRCDGIS